MSDSPIVKINPDEQFPHLNNAPIVEAAINLRARAMTEWTESVVSEVFKAHLPDYPKTLSMDGFQQQFTVGPGISPEAKTIDTGWVGIRFLSEDGLQVAQFNRDGFTFSRLRPYEQWERLIGEALRLWKMFEDVAKPTEIQRIGLRFINRIDLPHREVDIDDYLQSGPREPQGLGLPFQHFFHQDTFDVPGYPYAIKSVRTIQPGVGPHPQPLGLIVDIDVGTTEPFELGPDSIEQRLTEMRWLKNKFFFGSVTSKVVEAFK